MNDPRARSSHLLDLLRREQGAMADFLLALAVFDKDRAWLALGYTSLFYYLRRELKLSAGAAFHRKTAAELIQRFPEVAEPLRDGRLCLSSVCELAKVLTPENRAEVLPRFFHASKQEAKAVAAEIAPCEVVPQRVVVTAPARTSPAVAMTNMLAGTTGREAASAGNPFHLDETTSASVSRAEPLTQRSAPAAAPRASAEPLTGDLRRLHVTVSKRFLNKLHAAKDALSHSHPGADVEAILEAGLDALLERAAKRKGLVARSRKGAESTPADADERNSRYVPAAVRREVWQRDEGRCQWELAGGGICGSTHQCELDHVVPFARGGKATVDGLRVLCRTHNDLAARQAFGDEWMDAFTGAARGSRGATAPRPPRGDFPPAKLVCS
jgi:hypothetical protein